MTLERFSDLMSYRVQEILLVASQYDAFMLEEDGQLTELMLQESRDQDLTVRHLPRFTRAENGAEALQRLGERPFDMVVTTARLADMRVEALGRKVKELYPQVPVGVLAAHAWEIPLLAGLRESGAADWVFLWLGDVKALLAMIRQQEDRRNADHDVLERGVQAIVLVEDDVRFYSFTLPFLYTEVTQQTSRLMAEGLNLSHRLLRLRARPKILLAQTYEEAWDLFDRYAENVLGVITDLSFPRNGRMEASAGIDLARQVRGRDPEMPILLQTAEAAGGHPAPDLRAALIQKDSPHLLDELRRFMLENFGFGDFVFRTPDQTEIGKAGTLRELVGVLEGVPEACVVYHAGHNHFSRWCAARTEFELAALLRPRTVAEFPSPADLQRYIGRTIVGYLRDIQRTIITDFRDDSFDDLTAFAKIGSGSLGGKGRGLAFMQKLLAEERHMQPGVDVAIPQTVVLASDVFDEFMEHNGLRPLIQQSSAGEDAQFLDAFRRGRFERPLRAHLAKMLEYLREPVAVRSSSILEDSPYQPFAGVYATIMLPNNHPSLDIRLAQLLEAIKVVYASTYMKAARDYLETTPHRIDEERMAVLIQRLVGSPHGNHYYPTFSGIACSYNFYPFRAMRPEDGVVIVAMGLGKSVMEGYEALRFCPSYPRVLPQQSTPQDALGSAQRRFWALDLRRNDVIPGIDFDANLAQLDAHVAIDDGSADPISSTYMPQSDTFVNGVVPGGVPIVTFARILKGKLFPAPAILARLLQVSQEGMGVPVEIEFAVDIRQPYDAPQTFHVLQVRPMIVEQVARDVTLDERIAEGAVVYSPETLGHGRSHAIHDLVYVSADLERSRTSEVAGILEALNRRLHDEGRPYVLIGPGRWGSRDPWLGIPVAWSQISAARAIVETDFADLDVDPSQGSHFFHNLTCSGAAFFAVHRRHGSGTIDWNWLRAQPPFEIESSGRVRHVRFDGPLQILVDGANRRGVILAPRAVQSAV